MSELEQVITWLRTYEGHDILKDWHVDYTDQVPSCGAVFPQGLQEIERRTYITVSYTHLDVYKRQVSIYEPAMGLIHRINENELQFSREFELGRMRVVASADILRTHNGKKSLTDDVFVGLDGNEQSVGITPFAPALRNESYEARRQTYLKAIENLLGIKRGILSDAEAVSKTATEINSSAGDYSLSIMDFQHLYYDALQAALRLGDQIGQAYRLCDASRCV